MCDLSGHAGVELLFLDAKQRNKRFSKSDRNRYRLELFKLIGLPLYMYTRYCLELLKLVSFSLFFSF